jgi:hypothetical protein
MNTEYERLYDALKAAGIEMSNHESDLYFPDTPETRAILSQFPAEKANATFFINQVNHKPWIDVPFAYMPWWIARQSKS